MLRYCALTLKQLRKNHFRLRIVTGEVKRKGRSKKKTKTKNQKNSAIVFVKLMQNKKQYFLEK